MSKRRNVIITIGAAVLLLFAAVYWYWRNNRTYNWDDSAWITQSYSEKYKEPYGSAAFHKLLEGYFRKHAFQDIEDVAKELPDSTHNGENYVFIGTGLYLDSAGTERLLNFVRGGNTALLISKSLPKDLMSRIYDAEKCGYDWRDNLYTRDTTVRVRLRSPDADSVFDAFYAVKNKPDFYNWNYVDSNLFCTDGKLYPLGYLNEGHTNFAGASYGKGRFLLHSNPILFSNYSLNKKPLQRYAANVLAHLSEGPCYWDTKSRVAEVVSRRRNGELDADSPHLLAFILQKPSLAWAWYLLAALTLLWIIFRAKRRNKVIPVLPKKENTSYEFINTIAHLHFKSGNYQSLAIQMMKLFCADIRERYNLNFSLDHSGQKFTANEQTLQQLSRSSGVPDSRIQSLMNLYLDCANVEATEKSAVALYREMETFWRLAR